MSIYTNSIILGGRSAPSILQETYSESLSDILAFTGLLDSSRKRFFLQALGSSIVYKGLI